MDIFQKMNDAMKKAQESYTKVPIEDNETIQKVLNYLEKIGEAENFKNNLKTLTIRKNTYLNNKQPDGNYNPHSNTITINKEEALLHELIHCASTKDYDNEGVLLITYPNDFDKDIIITGKSFNEGLCDYLSKEIDPSYELRYPLEELIVERIIDKYGAEIIHYFLNSDSKRFHEEQVECFKTILKAEQPDVIHIWGTEYPHSFAMVEAAEQVGQLERIVISIQGLVSVYAQHFFSDFLKF